MSSMTFPKSAMQLFVYFVCLVVVSTRPTFRATIPNGLNIPCPEGQEQACVNGVCEGVGHQTCRGGGLRNSFGMDFFEAGLEWNLELCKKDSDGDGVPNGVELGDPCCLFNPDIADIFPQVNYGLSHPGFDSSFPVYVPEINIGYCQQMSNKIEELRMNRFTEIFQEGEFQLQLDLTMNNYTVPSNSPTTYAYPRFSFPTDKEYDIVAIQPIIHPQSAQYVHHFVLYGCQSEWQGEDGQVLWEGIPVGPIFIGSDCFETVWVWAPGINSLILPPTAGYHVGQGSGIKSFVLELHYDNPQLTPAFSDNSGVRLYFTEGNRNETFGCLSIGPGIFMPRFEQNQESFYASSITPVARINETIAPEGVAVFASFAHAHMFGRKIFSSILRRNEGKQAGNDKFLGYEEELMQVKKDMDVMPTFSFANQRIVPMANTYIKSGDYIGVTCVYNTTTATKPVGGGWGSRDEMCNSFVYVYPMEAFELQGFTIPIITQSFWVGRVVTGIANKNALSIQNVGVVPWVDFQSQIHRFGCLESIGGQADNLTEIIFILEQVCGLEGFVQSIVEVDSILGMYYYIVNWFQAMPTCSQQCGFFLSASFGCLASRYGKIVDTEQGQQFEHFDLKMLITFEDIFYSGYWWALYHNFPQVCDSILNQYIMADSTQQHSLASDILKFLV